MPIAPATFRVADPERRFRAFVVDRAIAWTLFALAGLAAWWWFFRDDRIVPGIGFVVAVVVVVSLVFAVLLGRFGVSPGRAAFGLRVVNAETGDPIGIGPALVRTTVVGVGSLPMFGLGLATLAWTAVDDHTGERRGWHDHVARSVVLDIRPVAVREELTADRPRHVVNLTAMRLMPVKEVEPPVVPAPVQGRTGSHEAGPRSSTPSGSATRSPEQGPSTPIALERAEPVRSPAGDAAAPSQSVPPGSPGPPPGQPMPPPPGPARSVTEA
ncbi:MAG: RDD family protein, partial [Nocardioides sp.]|nr:RDD family protein [Nocardioides sp.]